jgi:ketosteroid isomerase-like protein
MSDLQAIADRFEIEALRGEFTDASMRLDFDRFASLFTEDGAWRMPHIDEELVTREVIRAGIERLRALWDYFVQTVHPGTIELDGDAAVGRSYVSEFGRFRDGSSMLNYSGVPRQLRAHPGRLEVRGARLRGPIPRHQSARGLAAPRSGRRPLARSADQQVCDGANGQTRPAAT